MEFSAVGCNVLHEYAVGVNYNRLKIATDDVIYICECVCVCIRVLSPPTIIFLGWLYQKRLTQN